MTQVTVETTAGRTHGADYCKRSVFANCFHLGQVGGEDFYDVSVWAVPTEGGVFLHLILGSEQKQVGRNVTLENARTPASS